MTILLTLTVAGTNTGPFDLYSDLDGYVVPFETDVPKASLLAGHLSSSVPDYTKIVKVQCKGVCNTFVEIVLDYPVYPYTLFQGDTPEEACEEAS